MSEQALRELIASMPHDDEPCDKPCYYPPPEGGRIDHGICGHPSLYYCWRCKLEAALAAFESQQPQTREGGERRIRHMTIQEHARTIAANWVYSVYSWRGRSAQFMQGQVSKLTEEIAAAETIAYEAGADAVRAAGQPEPRPNAQDRLVVGDEINQCLQIIVTNAGNIAVGIRTDSETALSARRIEKAVARAAKAVLTLADWAGQPEQPREKGKANATEE